MVGDIETLAARAGALPAVFDARESAVIEVDSAFGDRLFLKEICMEDSDSDEPKDRNQEPAGSKAVRAEIDPDESDLTDYK